MAEEIRSDQTRALSEARVAYEMALLQLEETLPHTQREPVVIDPATISWLRVLLHVLLLLPLALFRIVRNLFREIGRAWNNLFSRTKTRLITLTTGQPAVLGGPVAERQHQIRMLLLEVLWARDHVQDTIEDHDGASYASKREALTFVMANETRLQRIGQLALEQAGVETSDLREVQPTAPQPDRWWWFLNLPRARRARRMNMLWFVLAIIPALASIVLITLLAQRLAINGPDLLSGASVVAQVGLGLASIIAGREILNDLILRGARVSWQGQLTFALASLFLLVVVIFYFLAPPGAALVYNVFGQQAIKDGNAAEAELYLESAARLDPDPYAASLLEVGCLYQTLGSPDRAQSVFERVLEADSRLLLARYHLAELYSDRSEYDKALRLLEDGLTLLDAGRTDIQQNQTDFLPGISTLNRADQMEYLLRLARGRAYVESQAPEQAKGELRKAEELYADLVSASSPEALTMRANRASDRLDLSCGPEDNWTPFILSTAMNLHYNLARTYDELCNDEATINAARLEWRLVRNGIPTNSRQEAWRDDAVRRLNSGLTCTENYGISAELLGLTGGAPK